MPRSPRRAAGPAPSPEPVRLSAVGFGYAERPDVLRDVNLILPRGSFHFLTGASGAGKSSLLKLLTLAVPPTSGEVVLFGDDVSRISPRSRPTYRRRMGVVFQDFRLVDHLSVFDNVALPLRLMGRKADQYRDDVTEMLDWVGLSDRARGLPGALSGGEKQRLAIARAVMAGPELILADEPTGSVDSAMAGRLLKLFQAMNRIGTTILIASHDQALARASGAQLLRLADGRVTAVKS